MGLARTIRIVMVKQGNITEAELARRLGQSPANFNGKMKRDNFSERELREIAEALGCTLDITFTDKETGEKT
jgi:transcriptional regulator with XRE-family HTH domain